jgi:hypothetical protein
MDDIGEGEAMNDEERMERYHKARSKCIDEIDRRFSHWYIDTLEIIRELSRSERCRRHPNYIDCNPYYIAEKRKKAIQEAIDECVKKKMEQEGF